MKDFFITYAEPDEESAVWIAWQLEKDDRYQTIIQAWDFLPGTDFVLEMDRAAKQSARTIAVLSESYLKSLYTQREWAEAFRKSVESGENALIVVRIGKCELTGLLANVSYIDLVGLDKDQAREKLLSDLEVLETGRKKPSAEPQFGMDTALELHEAHKYWLVPLHRNPYFTGRETLIAGLRSRLSANSTTALHQAVQGLGGVGKTQLALEYCYLYKEEYDYVMWVLAEDELSLAAEYSALSRRLSLSSEDSQSDHVQLLKDWLETHSRWLLVLDNAQGPDQLRNFLPSGNNGHIIITSRNPSWGSIAQNIEVGPMTPEESVKFLLDRSDQQDEAAASELAADLGYLPLALDQAGAYIYDCGGSIEQYIRLFNEERNKHRLLSEPADYRATVATTWEVSLLRLQEQCPDAVVLIRLLSFLAPEPIPTKVIRVSAVRPADGESEDDLVYQIETVGASIYIDVGKPVIALPSMLSDEIELNATLTALKRHSMVYVADDNVRMHRLVQAVVRERVRISQAMEYVKAATRIVLNFSIRVHGQDAEELETLQRHALAVIKHNREFDVSGGETIELLIKLAEAHEKRGDFDRALHYYEWALRDGKEADEDALVIARIMNEAARMRLRTGDHAGAEELLTGAKSLIPDRENKDANDAASMLNLAALYAAKNQIDDADRCFHEALLITESLPDDTVLLSAVLNNWAGFYRDTKRFDQAHEMYDRLIEVAEKAASDDEGTSSDVQKNLADALAGLASLHAAQENYVLAEPLLTKALSSVKKSFAENSPVVGDLMSSLGSVCFYLNRLEEAESYIERALPIAEANHSGRGSPVPELMAGLAAVYDAQGKSAASLKMQQRALQYKESVGVDKSELWLPLNNLGMALHKTGDNQAAEEPMRQSLAIRELLFGDDHPTTAHMRSNLARVLRELGEPKEAMECVEHALRSWSMSDDPMTEKAGRAHWTLGLLLMDQNRDAEALAEVQTALEIYRNSGLDEDHEFVKAATSTRRELESNSR